MTFQLKDGRTCTIRECVEADAERVLKLFRIVAAESDNLGRLPDEIKLTIEEEREYIRARRDSSNSIIVLAEVGGRAVALAGVEGQKLKKFAHHGELGSIQAQQEFGHAQDLPAVDRHAVVNSCGVRCIEVWNRGDVEERRTGDRTGEVHRIHVDPGQRFVFGNLTDRFEDKFGKGLDEALNRRTPQG